MNPIDIIVGCLTALIAWLLKSVVSIQNEITTLKVSQKTDSERAMETRNDLKNLEHELKHLRETIIELNSTLRSKQF